MSFELKDLNRFRGDKKVIISLVASCRAGTSHSPTCILTSTQYGTLQAAHSGLDGPKPPHSRHLGLELTTDL